MSLPSAYLGIILIWSTTPLAIKWSAEGTGFAFGVAARMVIGLVLTLMVLRALRISIPWDSRSIRSYAVSAFGLYGAMSLTYWGAQFVPSGLISVLFGLSPLVTGLFAAAWLGERFLLPNRLAGMTLGLVGLSVIFNAADHLTGTPWNGIAAVLLAVFLHSGSGVGVKRLGLQGNPLAFTGGTLAFAVPAFIATWLFSAEPLALELHPRAASAILYLGIFGTVVGMSLFFYVLRHLPAGVISLVTLITPVLALLLGQGINDEVIPATVWSGAAIILLGLGLYQARELSAAVLRLHARLCRREGEGLDLESDE